MKKRISYKNFTSTSKRASAAGRGASKKFNTAPELRLRKYLWKKGLRYRKNYNGLPGFPDIVFKGKQVAVFCDGDFWHGNNWSTIRSKLKKGSNPEYWIAKIERNMERDLKINEALQEKGWSVLRFWESEINQELEKVVDIILKTLQAKK